MKKVKNYKELVKLNARTSWNVLNDIVPIEFIYEKTKNRDYRLTTNPETGMSHVFDDINSFVDGMLDTAYELYYEKQQEDEMNKLIDHIVDDMVKGTYEETEDGNLVGADGTVYVEQPRSSSSWKEVGASRWVRRNINPNQLI